MFVCCLSPHEPASDEPPRGYKDGERDTQPFVNIHHAYRLATIFSVPSAVADTRRREP